MPVCFDAASGVLSLHTDHTTYQLAIRHRGLLLHTWYGPRVTDDMSYAIPYADRGFSGNPADAEDDRTVSCDTLPQEYPCEGSGDFRATAFGLRDQGGVSGCDLRYVGHRVLPGKYTLPRLPAVFAEEGEAETVEITLQDLRLPVQVRLLYGVLPGMDCITRSAVITNRGDAPVTLENAASLCLDFLHGEFDRIAFWGKHSLERQAERRPVGHGEEVFGSRRGASSHHMNPFLVLCDRDATEDSGLALGCALMWSGSFSARVGLDAFGQTRLTMGIQNERFNYLLQPGESFTAPEAVMVLSEQGLGEMSRRFHRLILGHVLRFPRPDMPRPVLINNWEATYMDFTGDKIVEIARQAAGLGVDMMVLDDGWFGRRSSDHDGLGDWWVNEEKLGCSLPRLAERIRRLGMKFGLWIEPEMVNRPSDLAREHPDWIFTIPGKPPVTSRDQLVLDFSRPDVVDAILERLDRIITEARVDYIKMDMNRSLNDVYTQADFQSQGKVLYRYTLGVYRFLQALRDRHPDLLIEGCSGGGGRFDLGMLYFTPQIWCSDDTDPIERLKIQYGTSFCYPPCVMGAHVSVSPSEQTGRVTPLSVRGAVAMAGTFGYELDPARLSPEEKEEVRQQIRTFRRYQPLMLQGDYYRLTDNMADREKAAWMFVSPDKSEALVTWVTRDAHDNPAAQFVTCRGLDPEALYRDEATGEARTGAALMRMGLLIPRSKGEYTARQIHLLRV